jgi:phosphatidylglycerophosphate synthase
MELNSLAQSIGSFGNAVGRKVTVKTQLVFSLSFGAVVTVASALLLVGLNLPALTLSIFGYLVGVFLVVALFQKGYPHPFIGFGNLVTMLRLALTASLLAPVVGSSPTEALVFLATLLLLLDGVDGSVARRELRVSSFGARLDIEVDSAFAVILVINIWAAGIAGPLILLLAAPRYLFMGFSQFLPWLKKSLPARTSSKVVGVIHLISLILLNVREIASWLAVPIVVVVSLGLIWSFGRDVLMLWRLRHS